MQEYSVSIHYTQMYCTNSVKAIEMCRCLIPAANLIKNVGVKHTTLH
jgi:hypothetical protein